MPGWTSTSTIEVTGIRPGEKLEEDLREPDEEVLETEHPSISRLLPVTAPTAWFDSLLGQLADATRLGDAERVRRLLFAIADSSLDGEPHGPVAANSPGAGTNGKHLMSLPSAHRRHESAAVRAPHRRVPRWVTRTDDRLVVVGQGYAGLPVAMRAVEVGFDVVGFDVDVAKIKRLAAGESHVEDVTSDVVARRWQRGATSPPTTRRARADSTSPSSTSRRR